MSQWNIYYKQEEVPIPVKEGFNWWAFFLPTVWSMVKLLPIPTVIGISFAFAPLIQPDAAPLVFIFVLVFMFFCGFKGNEWVGKSLEKNGYKIITLLSADNKKQAYDKSFQFIYAGDAFQSPEQSNPPPTGKTSITDKQTTSSGPKRFGPTILWALGIFLILFIVGGIYSWTGIKTYDECILKNIEEVKTDKLAMQIHHSCSRAYPERAKRKSGPILFGPKNYDECILKHSKNIESNNALTLIRNACAIYPTK